MAIKGQKFNHHSDELILKIVEEYLSGKSSRGFLAKKYNILDGTIANWIYKYKKVGTIKRNNHLKGRKKDSNIDYKERYEILKKETLYNNNITSLQEYIIVVEDWLLFYNTKRLKSK